MSPPVLQGCVTRTGQSHPSLGILCVEGGLLFLFCCYFYLFARILQCEDDVKVKLPVTGLPQTGETVALAIGMAALLVGGGVVLLRRRND